MTHNGPSASSRPVLLGDGNVAFINKPRAMWEAMLDGWLGQQASRGLARSTIDSRRAVLVRFQRFTELYPWEWTPQDLEDFTVDAGSRRRLALSTHRQNHDSIRLFCEYLTDSAYDWVALCEESFDAIPSQICLPWNTVRHGSEYEGQPGRRPLTYEEVERFFEVADSRVERLVSAGKKGALAALRDAQLFKTVYAFGLRRAEVRGLDLVDLHFNAQAPQWGHYAALHVRHAKASNGGARRRRTVLLVPEMSWWVAGMQQWVEEARARFAPGDLVAMWVTERRTRVSAAYIDTRFQVVRDEAALDSSLTLHSLRHSYVTHLIEHGYADRFVQEQVGHRHASTTSIYTSVSGDFKNRVLADALSRINSLE